MNDRMAELVFYVLLLILPIAGLMVRRPPLGRTLRMIAAWIAIFAVGLAVASQRDRVARLFVDRSIEGGEKSIPMAADGHFWVDATIDGVSRRMLIDSGATTTALSQATADAIGIDDYSAFPVVLNTANGKITARTATANRVEIGTLVARDVPVVVSPAFGGTDVIGMNMLARLAKWARGGTSPGPRSSKIAPSLHNTYYRA